MNNTTHGAIIGEMPAIASPTKRGLTGLVTRLLWSEGLEYPQASCCRYRVATRPGLASSTDTRMLETVYATRHPDTFNGALGIVPCQ